MGFEWDSDKAARNLKKHGIDFAYAARVFLDPYRLDKEEDSEDYLEDRYQTIGIVEDWLLTAVYTYRDQNIRLISARRSTPNERRIYHEF